jgi:hypothetical protein
MGRIYGLPSDVKSMGDIKKAKNYPEFEKWMKSKGKGYGWKKAKDSKSKGVYIDFNPDTQIVKNNSGKPLTVIGEDGIPIELPGDYWDISTTYKLIDQFENVGGSGKDYSWWVFNYTNSLPVNILNDSQFAAMKADPQWRAVEQAVNIGGYNSSKLATLPGTEWNRSILLSAGLPEIDKFWNESERQSRFYVAEKIGSKPVYVDLKVKKTSSLLSKGRVGTLAGGNGSEALAEITGFEANDTIELFGPPENLTTDKPIMTYDQFMANKTRAFCYKQQQSRVAELIDRDGNPNGTLNETDLVAAADIQARAWLNYLLNKTGNTTAGYYNITTIKNATDPYRTDAKANFWLKRPWQGGRIMAGGIFKNGTVGDFSDDFLVLYLDSMNDTDLYNDVGFLFPAGKLYNCEGQALTLQQLYDKYVAWAEPSVWPGFAGTAEIAAMPVNHLLNATDLNGGLSIYYGTSGEVFRKYNPPNWFKVIDVRFIKSAEK